LTWKGVLGVFWVREGRLGGKKVELGWEAEREGWETAKKGWEA
jgi:hypothetical protein